MKNIYSFFLLIALGSMVSFSLQAQSISRSVICSIGATQTGNNGNTLLSTYGQCPGCTMLVGQNGQLLLQGFQQPGGLNPDCVDIAAFDFEPNYSPCGTTYSFIYLGNANVDQVWWRSFVHARWPFSPTGFLERRQCALCCNAPADLGAPVL